MCSEWPRGGRGTRRPRERKGDRPLGRNRIPGSGARWRSVTGALGGAVERPRARARAPEEANSRPARARRRSAAVPRSSPHSFPQRSPLLPPPATPTPVHASPDPQPHPARLCLLPPVLSAPHRRPRLLSQLPGALAPHLLCREPPRQDKQARQRAREARQGGLQEGGRRKCQGTRVSRFTCSPCIHP